MSNSSNRIGQTNGQFSVAIFFEDGTHEYARRWVGAEEGVKAFHHHCLSVGAQLGTTTEVRLIDGEDYTNMHWKWDEGIVFPIEHTGLFRHGKSGELPRGPRVQSNPPADASVGRGGDYESERRNADSAVESEASPEAGERSRRSDAADEG